MGRKSSRRSWHAERTLAEQRAPPVENMTWALGRVHVPEQALHGTGEIEAPGAREPIRMSTARRMRAEEGVADSAPAMSWVNSAPARQSPWRGRKPVAPASGRIIFRPATQQSDRLAGVDGTPVLVK